MRMSEKWRNYNNNNNSDNPLTSRRTDGGSNEIVHFLTWSRQIWALDFLILFPDIPPADAELQFNQVEQNHITHLRHDRNTR